MYESEGVSVHAREGDKRSRECSIRRARQVTKQ